MKVPDAKEIGITIRTHKLMNKALMLCGLHKFKKSVNCVDKVIELNPKLAKAWNLKGFVYDIWGKTLEDKVDRQFRFGEVPEKRLEASVEKNVEALKCYDMAIKLNPKYLKAWNNKARILVRLGKAIEESRRVLPQMGSTFKGKPTKWRYPDDMFQQAQYCCDEVLILGQTSWESEDTASLNPTKTEERGIDLDILDNHGWDSSDRMAQRTLLMKGNISHHMSRMQSIYYSSGGFTIDEDDPEYDKLVTERINNYLEEAVTWYKGATMVNQEYIEAWHYMGLAYHDLDKGDDALDCFAKTLRCPSSILVTMPLNPPDLVISGFPCRVRPFAAASIMKLLLDFFPVVAFFVAYQITDIYVATATIMVAMVFQIIVLWLWKRSIGRMVLLSTLLVLIFGSITLWLRDGIFIQWKPTVIYILLALGFSGAQLLTKSTPMERLMGETITINSAIWRKINVMWIGVFLFLAVTNLFVVYNFSESTWVNFKLFGVLGVTLVATIAQVIWITRHTNTDKNPSSTVS